MPILTDGTVLDLDFPTQEEIFVSIPDQPSLEVVAIGGPRGPAGSGSSSALEYIQASPSASWVIPVPPEMGRTPGVTVYVDGQEVMTDVFADQNSVNIVFDQPTTGSAVLT